jgi:hypothetical protein
MFQKTIFTLACRPNDEHESGKTGSDSEGRVVTARWTQSQAAINGETVCLAIGSRFGTAAYIIKKSIQLLRLIARSKVAHVS